MGKPRRGRGGDRARGGGGGDSAGAGDRNRTTQGKSSRGGRAQTHAGRAQPGDALVGRCTEMCPAREVSERHETGELSQFEFSKASDHPGQAKQRGRATLAVKCYRRSAAGVEKFDPDEVRDEATLRRTMRHLSQLFLSELAKPGTANHDGLTPLYEFVSDRFRAIRQDYAVQNLRNATFCATLEEQVAVHVYALVTISSRAPAQRARRRAWPEPKLCFEQLMQCLAPLIELYAELGPGSSQRQDELQACWLMTHAGSPAIGGILAADLCEMASSRGKAREAALKLVMGLQRGSWREYLGAGAKLRERWPVLGLFHRFTMPVAICPALAAFNAAFTAREPMLLDRLTSLIRSSESCVVEGACRRGGLPCSDPPQAAITFRSAAFSSESTVSPSTWNDIPESAEAVEVALESLRRALEGQVNA